MSSVSVGCFLYPFVARSIIKTVQPGPALTICFGTGPMTGPSTDLQLRAYSQPLQVAGSKSIKPLEPRATEPVLSNMFRDWEAMMFTMFCPAGVQLTEVCKLRIFFCSSWVTWVAFRCRINHLDPTLNQ